MDKQYIKGLVEADLLHADRCIRQLTYTDWSDEDKSVISKYLHGRKKTAENHLNRLNGTGDSPPTMVPALSDAEG